MKTNLSLIELIEYFSFSVIHQSEKYIEISNQINRYLIFINERQEHQIFCLSGFQLLDIHDFFFRHSCVASETELHNELSSLSNFESSVRYVNFSGLISTGLNVVISYFLGSKNLNQLSHNTIDLTEHLFSEISNNEMKNLFGILRTASVPSPFSDLFSDFQPKSTHLLSFLTKTNSTGKPLNGLVAFNENQVFLLGSGGYKKVNEGDSELIDLFFSPITVYSNYLRLDHTAILLCDLKEANILAFLKEYNFHNVIPNIREEGVLDWIQFYQYMACVLRLQNFSFSYSPGLNDFNLIIPECSIKDVITPIDFNNKLKVLSISFEFLEQTISEIPAGIFTKFSEFSILNVSSNYHTFNGRKMKVWNIRGIHHPLIYSKLYYLLREIVGFDLKESIV